MGPPGASRQSTRAQPPRARGPAGEKHGQAREAAVLPGQGSAPGARALALGKGQLQGLGETGTSPVSAQPEPDDVMARLRGGVSIEDRINCVSEPDKLNA